MENNEMKEFELKENTLELAIGGQGQDGTGVPGMKCPQCGEFIPTTIQQISVASCLVCPHCQLRMNIDKSASRRAIDALKKVNAAQNAVEEKKKSYN